MAKTYYVIHTAGRMIRDQQTCRNCGLELACTVPWRVGHRIGQQFEKRGNRPDKPTGGWVDFDDKHTINIETQDVLCHP